MKYAAYDLLDSTVNEKDSVWYIRQHRLHIKWKMKSISSVVHLICYSICAVTSRYVGKYTELKALTIQRLNQQRTISSNRI